MVPTVSRKNKIHTTENGKEGTSFKTGLLYGSETTNKMKSRENADMTLLRPLAGYTLKMWENKLGNQRRTGR